jgi:hypothetical protein
MCFISNRYPTILGILELSLPTCLDNLHQYRRDPAGLSVGQERAMFRKKPNSWGFLVCAGRKFFVFAKPIHCKDPSLKTQEIPEALYA